MKTLLPWIPWIALGTVIVAVLIVGLRALRRRRDLIEELTILQEMATRPADHPLQVRKYRIQRKIGAGGMAKVYRAAAPDGRVVALKIPDPHFFQTEEHRTFFNQELSVSRKMVHPNIVRILDHSDGSGGDLPYIAMEYVDGVTLDKMLPKKRPVPVPFAAGILHDVAAALKHAHNMGIVHRDIKPENIMITGDGTVKVADFGIARDKRDRDPASEDSNAFVGSPHYMSPEQINSGDVDYKTDYYALGVVAFRLLTGFLPFEGENTMEIITRKISQLPPPPSTYNPNLPIELEALVRELMQREPERRPEDATGFIKTLKKFVPPVKKKRGAPKRASSPSESDF